MDKPTIEPCKGGWMVRLPGGDCAWQPSKQFAEAYVRQWLARNIDYGCAISTRDFPDTF